MGKLIYSAIASLDGYIEDEDGTFDWAAPDEEVHAFVNDLERPVGTHLYGRRMYETMVFWETVQDEQPVIRDFAEIWRAADKIVYSRTLESVSSADAASCTATLWLTSPNSSFKSTRWRALTVTVNSEAIAALKPADSALTRYVPI